MILFGLPVLVYDDVLSSEEHNSIYQECRSIKESDLDTKAIWDCNVYTTCHASDMLTNSIFKNMLNVFEEKASKFLDIHGVDEKCKVVDSWFNAYDGFQYQDQHKHYNCLVSSVYFLKAPEGSAPLKFISPYQNDFIFKNYTNEVLKYERYIKAVENRLVVFLSSTPHAVPLGSNEETRYTIATNYITKE